MRWSSDSAAITIFLFLPRGIRILAGIDGQEECEEEGVTVLPSQPSREQLRSGCARPEGIIGAI
jgi:hypothetical protein